MSPVVLDLVQKVLTYRNDIGAEKAQLFYQLKRAKNNKKLYHAILAKIKHLESTEWVCWFNLKDRSFPTGHLNIVKMALEKLGADVQYVDEREKPGPDGFLPWYNEPFPPRYYQKEMIDLCLQQGRGVCVSAVGTGKSLIMGRVIQQLSVNTLIVVPSRGLSDQIYNDFKVWFGADKVEIRAPSPLQIMPRTHQKGENRQPPPKNFPAGSLESFATGFGFFRFAALIYPVITVTLIV